MPVSFLSSKKTVLLIADESLYVYCVKGSDVSLIHTTPWNQDGFLKDVLSVIKNKCGSKPILILNDMVEQHYRKEKVLKSGVNALDKASMIKRKLAVAFPDHPVRAAYPLKEKDKTMKGGVSADIYIFAAMPETRQLEAALKISRESYATLKGLCLLPVESADMVKALAAKISKAKKNKAKWCVFMGQHQHGGLRQIVTKNGELALTRVTPINDDDSDVHRWVSDVNQEFKATMSYLSRFGYTPEDGVDVIVISNADAGSLLSEVIEENVNFHAMTVSEAARTLGLGIGHQENQKYADPLHVSWIAQKRKLTLPMHSLKFEDVKRPRQAAMAASVVLMCTAAFLGYQLFSQGAKFTELNTQINDARKKRVLLEEEYQKEVDIKESMGLDIRLVQGSALVHEKLENENVAPLDMFSAIGRSLGRDLRLDKVEIKPYEADVVEQFSTADPVARNSTDPEPLYTTALQMTYPSTTDIDRGNQEVNELSQRLTIALPDYNVVVTKLLRDYEYTEGLVVEAGELEQKDIAQDFVAQIEIRGPMKQSDDDENSGAAGGYNNYNNRY